MEVLQTSALPLGDGADRIRVLQTDEHRIVPDAQQSIKDAAERAAEWTGLVRMRTTFASHERRLERETGFEPATSTLARSHSTTELFPLAQNPHHSIRPAGQSTGAPASSCVERPPVHFDLRARAERRVDGHHVEPAGTIGHAIPRQVLERHRRDLALLGVRHALRGGPELRARTRLDLHEHQRPGVLRHDVDLAMRGAVAPLEYGVATAGQLRGRQLLTDDAEQLALERHGTGVCDASREPDVMNWGRETRRAPDL